ncbi:DoxX family membrane protein [Cellulomonas sp. DKR-3]|uniref:DoxX family membrane protein n=1 Tax=Cellulomonas fulva TaxID=2835530 RepID=A0ABS5U204_9CELL|nr:DoxX family membrane protein [Cellulomonas fulva]MBT0995429.1 DoxX family membrane protein [Cellulomonas fulva]
MLLRRIARPLFASWFVSEGMDALRRPAPHVADARAALDRLERTVPSAQVHLTDTQLTAAVRAHGAAVVAASGLLAFGKAPRTAALVLAGLTAPLVVVNLPDRTLRARTPEEKRARRDRLVRALAFTAGAVLVGADYEGRPGVRWRIDAARERHAAVKAATSDEG